MTGRGPHLAPACGRLGRVTDLDTHGRRVERLRLELDDEGIWVPEDEALLRAAARRARLRPPPPRPRGRRPALRRPALVGGAADEHRRDRSALVDVGDVSLNVVRRLADGRSSFVVRMPGARDRLVCFDRTREYESSAVHLTLGTGALVLQRLGRGWVRLSTPQGVATWDGMHWATKQLSINIAERVAPHAGRGRPDGAGQPVEVCTHWLAAGRVGATLVWSLDGDPATLGHLGMAPAVAIPRARPVAPVPLRAAAQRAGAVRPGRARRRRRPHLDRRRPPAIVRGQPARPGAVPGDPPHRGVAVLGRGADSGRLRRVVERCAVGVLAGPPPRHRLIRSGRPRAGEHPAVERSQPLLVRRTVARATEIRTHDGWAGGFPRRRWARSSISRQTSAESRTSNGNGRPAR